MISEWTSLVCLHYKCLNGKLILPKYLLVSFLTPNNRHGDYYPQVEAKIRKLQNNSKYAGFN